VIREGLRLIRRGAERAARQDALHAAAATGMAAIGTCLSPLFGIWTP